MTKKRNLLRAQAALRCRTLDDPRRRFKAGARSKCRKCRPATSDERTARRTRLGDAHRFDLGHDLLERNHAPEGQELTRDLIRAGLRALERGEQPDLELRSRARDLDFAGILGSVGELVDDDTHQFAGIAGVRPRIDAEHAGIGERRMKG